MQPELLNKVQEALIDLTQAISGSDTARMLAAMERLDGFAEKSARELPPRLLHFLQQRSYAKAHAWLGER